MDLEPGVTVRETEVVEHEEEWEHADGAVVHASQGDCGSADGPLVVEVIQLERP